jgi:hypothetical protein
MEAIMRRVAHRMRDTVHGFVLRATIAPSPRRPQGWRLSAAAKPARKDQKSSSARKSCTDRFRSSPRLKPGPEARERGNTPPAESSQELKRGDL